MSSARENNLEQLFGSLPESIGAQAIELCKCPLRSKNEIIQLIADYADKIEQVAHTREDIDVNLADCISRRCLILLNEHWEVESEQNRQLIQAACCYFVESDDDDDDFESVFGFDDDAELLNLILEHFERDELLIQI